MRERRYLTFDMQNPRHRKAFALFTAQPSKLRSKFVVNCILSAQEENQMEKTIRQVISEALHDAAFTITAPQQVEERIQATEDVSDLPDVLLSSLEEL